MVYVTVYVQERITVEAVIQKSIIASATILGGMGEGSNSACPVIDVIDGGSLGSGDSQYSPVNGLLGAGTL